MNFYTLLLTLLLSTTTLATVFNFTSVPKYTLQNIKLNKNNFFAIREVVSPASISKAIMDISFLQDKNPYLKEYYLVLDTPGGSVVSGNELIDYMNYLNNTGIHINCIAKKAISMGFVILQSCPGIRLALPSSMLMQHQMSTLMMGNILNIESDMKYSKRLYEKMLIKQSHRIGVEPDTFLDKTRDDWWLDGEMALENNVVDKLVNLGCSGDLIKTQITIERETLFGPISIKTSKCPII